MKAAIVLNGEGLAPDLQEDFVICADGGYKRLQNRLPDCIIGDMDSIGNIPDGIEIIRHNPEKNQTDGEISIEYAIQKGYKHITIYCALGGRLDHTLGNLALLKNAHSKGAGAKIVSHKVNIYYSERNFSLYVNKNDIVSVIPFGGDALIEDSDGLYYPLKNLLLKTNDTRGISNVARGDNISLKIAHGGVLVFHYFK